MLRGESTFLPTQPDSIALEMKTVSKIGSVVREHRRTMASDMCTSALQLRVRLRVKMLQVRLVGITTLCSSALGGPDFEKR